MYEILVQFIWDFIFAENAVFGVIYDVVGSLILTVGLDMTGYLETHGIQFQKVSDVVYLFAMQFIILKFVKKLIDVYGLQTDGDPSADVISLVINFCKAMVIAMTFTIIWNWIYDIVYDFANQIMNAVGVADMIGIYRGIQSTSQGQTDTFTFLLDPLIIGANGALMLMQLKNGLDLWLLRIGMPLACVGLMDSDQGVFKQYCRMILKCILTIIVQIFCINAGLYVLKLASQTGVSLIFYFISFAMVIMGFKTPKILGELLTPQNQGGGGKVMQAVYMGSMLLRM